MYLLAPGNLLKNAALSVVTFLELTCALEALRMSLEQTHVLSVPWKYKLI